jgi:hypothetical protein
MWQGFRSVLEASVSALFSLYALSSFHHLEQAPEPTHT